MLTFGGGEVVTIFYAMKTEEHFQCGSSVIVIIYIVLSDPKSSAKMLERNIEGNVGYVICTLLSPTSAF